jgi:predicted SAM-dependent methyltransferase
MPLDARQPLPFADSSFDFVFSEHLIEHIPFPAGCALLRECHRVLRPGGRIRIATPDLAFLVGLYKKGKSIMQQRYLDWSKEKFLPWAPNADDTYVINNAVRDWGHQFIYDEKVLQRALIEAGFTRLQRYPLMKSATPELAGLENEQRAPPGLVALETMVLEAYRG